MSRGDWTTVDQGWGRSAVDFATLSEPANCREYLSMHQLLRVDRDDRLLDIACGSGLAIELAAIRGARCAGIDASPRLISVARDRTHDADLRVGDMHDLPWPDDLFNVVTSFRGIWGTTPDALDEARRVLAPGGRLGVTVWGHVKQSPGAWALAPLLLASQPKVEHQAAMVALGRPGAGEELLTRKGFHNVKRFELSCVWEFPDPVSYARTIASSGPAYEAIETVGEEEFLRYAEEVAHGRVRDGLPLRADLALVGYTADNPGPARNRPTARAPVSAAVGFLEVPDTSPEAQELFDSDMNDLGYVMNGSRLWAHQPHAITGLYELMKEVTRTGELSLRQRGILVTATAATLGDSYCSLAWGSKLATEAGEEVAAGVLRGNDDHLSDSDKALATWARKVARDSNSTTDADVQALRDAGFTDHQIFAITAYVSYRISLSTINDALGVHPDQELMVSTPESVRRAVTYGRAIATPGT